MVSSCIYHSYIVLQYTYVIVDIHKEDGVIDQPVCSCLFLDFLSREGVLLKSNLLVVPLTNEDVIEKKTKTLYYNISKQKKLNFISEFHVEFFLGESNNQS